MSRYFFHLSGGVHRIDETGASLADLGAAKHEAVRIIGELLVGEPGKFVQHSDVTMTVSQGGSRVYAIRVQAGDA